MASINFFSEGTRFKLSSPTKIRRWLTTCAKTEGYEVMSLNYIFTSDSRLLKINQDYLQHDTFTDIITFDNSDINGQIEADIFISVPRVRENAAILNLSFEEELARVLVHGLLHLIGYSDKSAALKKEMKEKEDACLSLLRQ